MPLQQIDPSPGVPSPMGSIPQTVPQVPQLLGSLATSMHVVPLLHAMSGDWQPNWHCPATQKLLAAHAFWQVPQLAGLLLVSTQAPLHSVRPGAQVRAQVPAEQTSPRPQELPQAPQWLESALVSVQTSPQLVSLPGQPQLPWIQASCAEQVLPQAPQLFRSLLTEMHWPLQYC